MARLSLRGGFASLLALFALAPLLTTGCSSVCADCVALDFKVAIRKQTLKYTAPPSGTSIYLEMQLSKKGGWTVPDGKFQQRDKTNEWKGSLPGVPKYAQVSALSQGKDPKHFDTLIVRMALHAGWLAKIHGDGLRIRLEFKDLQAGQKVNLDARVIRIDNTSNTRCLLATSDANQLTAKQDTSPQTLSNSWDTEGPGFCPAN